MLSQAVEFQGMAASRRFCQRQAQTAALFLLLGAITTVLIAWTFALFGSVGRTQFSSNAKGVQPLAWPVRMSNHWPAHSGATESARARGIWVDRAGAVDDGGRRFTLFLFRYGWPWPTMRYRWQSISDASGEPAIDWSPFIALPQWLEEFSSGFATTFPAKRVLPLVPNWPDFAFSTIALAAIFWIILRLRRTVRASLRKHRRQCLACGYPIGDNAVCTECGQPLENAGILAET